MIILNSKKGDISIDDIQIFYHSSVLDHLIYIDGSSIWMGTPYLRSMPLDNLVFYSI